MRTHLIAACARSQSGASAYSYKQRGLARRESTTVAFMRGPVSPKISPGALSGLAAGYGWRLAAQLEAVG